MTRNLRVTVAAVNRQRVTVQHLRSRVVNPRALDPEQLVGAAEIAQRLGVVRDTVHLWRRRHADFPAPVAELEQAMVWYWPDVEAWAKASGRL